MELQSQVDALRDRGLGLAAFADRYAITYPLLSDVGSEVITRYGIPNTVADVESLDGAGPLIEEQLRQYVSVTQPSPRFRGIAFPGTFIVDPQGRVTERHFEDFYRERNTVLDRGAQAVRGASHPVIPGVRAAPAARSEPCRSRLPLTNHEACLGHRHPSQLRH